MALQTLLDAQREAAPALGINFDDIQKLQEPRLVMKDQIVVGGEVVDVYRAHSGGVDATGEEDFSDLIGKGGIRMAWYATPEAAEATVKELGVEMLSKLALRGYTEEFKGAKGLINVDARSLDHEGKQQAAEQFENAMERAGLAHYLKDVPAGDVGTNGLADTYALAHHKNRPQDSYWQAAITGKTPENGGLKFRTAATGWGSYVTQRTIMDAKGHDVVSTTIQGFGNVGAWHAHFASNDRDRRMRIQGISDVDGVLSTTDPEGIIVTEEMVNLIGDNPEFTGPKIHALKAMVEQQQPGIKLEMSDDPNAILTQPTDYFVPAAMGNAITDNNVANLGARLGIVEAANGPTTPSAHQYLTKKGVIVVPDIVANGAGVDCSIKEYHANVSGLVPPTEQVKKELTQATRGVVTEVLSTANHLGTHDLRVAAAGLSMAYMLRRSNPGLIRELIAA